MSYDDWSLKQSAAPHAPGHDRQVRGPAPVSAGMNIGGGEEWTPMAYPTAGVNPWLSLAIAFVVFIFAGPIFGALYPLATAVAVVAGMVAWGVQPVPAPGDEDFRILFAFLAAAVAFWPMCRLDHRLAARIPAYRLLRHLARVFLIAVYVVTLEASGGFWARALAQLANIGYVLRDPGSLLAIAVVGVVAHFLLTRQGLRTSWDRALEFVRMRPHGL